MGHWRSLLGNSPNGTGLVAAFMVRSHRCAKQANCFLKPWWFRGSVGRGVVTRQRGGSYGLGGVGRGGVVWGGVGGVRLGLLTPWV